MLSLYVCDTYMENGSISPATGRPISETTLFSTRLFASARAQLLLGVYSQSVFVSGSTKLVSGAQTGKLL